MVTEYAALKFIHIFVAIVALGTSAGLGIVLEFFANHPVHGPYVLRMIYRMTAWVVMPGYVLMLVTGAWLAHLSWSFSTSWIQAALGLWVVGAVLLGLTLTALRKQRMVLSRVLGGGTGLVVVTTLYFMVVKPAGFLPGWLFQQ